MTRVREILISVVGLTPQIITESLYCLTQVRKPPVRISEIWVITTVAGRKRVENELLAPREGWFFRFCADYGLDAGKIRFGPDQIVVI
jgi:CRISPR-associated protein Csx14